MNITNEDVEKEIYRLPPVNAGGNDGFCALIETFEDKLLQPLKIMFNRSI